MFLKYVTLINVYAPNREAEKRLLFISLGLLCNRNCVLVGDFNVFCSNWMFIGEIVLDRIRPGRIC